MKNLAVFVSGSGTNLENIAVCIENGKLRNCEIALVVCDKPKAFALERARNHKIKSVVVERETFTNKTGFEIAILNELNKHSIDFIVLAGYMRILGEAILKKFENKILNVHPALLPKFPGAHAIRDAFEAKAQETGVTVHFVDSGVDTGPVILRQKIKVMPNETLESLEKRIHGVEYALYPKVIQMLVDGKLKVAGGKVLYDGKPLTAIVQ